MARILVTYGTKHGSTAEIATRIGQRITAAGFDTDTLQSNLGIDITKYDALVVGSPIYAGQWLPEPTLLVAIHRERVENIPTALFSVGMIDVKHPGKLREEHDAWIEKAFNQEEIQLNIVSTGTFQGAYSRSNLPTWMRVVDSIIRIAPQGDHRQWDEIERWGDDVAVTLGRVLESDTVNETECP